MSKTKYSSEKYRNDVVEIKCSICNTIFNGTRHRRTCSKQCTKIAKLNGMSKNYERHYCKDCGVLTKEKVKYGKLSQPKIYRSKRCKQCSINNRKQWHENKKVLDKEKRKLTRQDTIDRIKHNMTVNNPMFKVETRDKVRKTFLEKIKTGEISYKKGKDHHSWVGNRDNNHIIRTRLKDWRKSILKESKFRCNRCNGNNKLEIHHTEPLREIIDKFTDKPLSQYNADSQEFENLIMVVKNYHENNDVGVCLCEECHAIVDPYRKQTIKNEN